MATELDFSLAKLTLGKRKVGKVAPTIVVDGAKGHDTDVAMPRIELPELTARLNGGDEDEVVIGGKKKGDDKKTDEPKDTKKPIDHLLTGEGVRAVGIRRLFNLV